MVLLASNLNKKPKEKEKVGEVRTDSEGKAYFYTYPKKIEQKEESKKTEEEPKFEDSFIQKPKRGRKKK